MKLDCKYKALCGGCNIDHYDTELNAKTAYVQDLFNKEKIDYNISDTVGMYYPYKYRNKIHLSITKVKNKTLIGFYEEKTKRVIDIDKCLLHDKWAEDLIKVIREYIRNFKLVPYDNLTRTGTIRYVVARYLNHSIQVTLVVTNQNFAGKSWLFSELQKYFKKVSIYYNLNLRTDNAVFDKNFIHKNGDKFLEGKLLQVNYKLSPNSFFQTNEKITEKMYEKSLELLDIKQGDNVLDLYSGIGITSVMFAKAGAKVSAIEYVNEATKNAKDIATLNNVSSLIHSYTGKCEDLLPNINIDKDNFKVFMDPARAGAEKAVLDTLLQYKPSKIVYMSCNPETLVRDLKTLLSTKEYKITFATPYDMFPHTKHVEMLVALEKK